MTTWERIKDCIRHLVFGMLGATLIICPFIPKYVVMSSTFDNRGIISGQYATKQELMELEIKIKLLKIEDINTFERIRTLVGFHESTLDYFDKVEKILTVMKQDIKDLDRRISAKK